MIAVQAASNGNSSGTSIAKAFTGSVTAGSCLVAALGLWTSGTLTGNTPTLTDSLGNTWTFVGRTTQNSNNFNSEAYLFVCFNSQGGGDTVTATYSYGGNVHAELIILEYGIAATATDGSAFINNNSAITGCTTSPFSTAVGGDHLIAFAFETADTSDTLTMATSGYTQEATHATDSTLVVWAQTGFSGSVTINVTGTHASILHCGVVALPGVPQSIQLFP